MRRAARRDANERPIVEAFRACGASVLRMDQPCDLLVGVENGRNGPATYLVEVKDPASPYGRKGLNPNQQEFQETWRGSPIHVVETVDDALGLLKKWRRA